MSINVGSNFLYQGTKFLDDRQNKINTLEDLKTWEIPIPDGFEVYVENSWYIFNSTNDFDDITGKFRKRTTDISQEFGASTDKVISQAVITERFNELDNNLNKLYANVFPLEFKSISGGGSFEVGHKVKPEISWTVGIKGENEILTPDNVTVNGKTDGITNKSSYTSSAIEQNIPGIVGFNVVVWYGNLNVSKTVNYNFYYRKYYGTSNKTELNSTDIINLSKGFIYGNSYSMSATSFDCTGGKYPYYVIPRSVYKESIEFWVGGLKNTDLITRDVSVTTSTGLTIDYITIRLNNIQNGKLSIEIK